jgi:DNA replication protein DnaC
LTAVCARCGGTGFEIVERDGREFAQPCSCRRPAGQDRSVLSFLANCRIPPRYEHCSIEHFEAGNESLEAARDRAKTYCRDYPYLGQDEGLGLLMTGRSGLGKTHLAVAVLRELWTTKGARGQFWDFHELIREIRNSYNEETRTTELQVLEPVMGADILLLDDLGAWKMTDWMLDTLFFVLNSRYLAKRSTLITTNFPDATPESVAGDRSNRRGEYLVERIGAPLRSRLMEMCLIIHMDGPDFRQIRQDGRDPKGSGRGRAAWPDPPPPPPRPRFGG